MEEARYWMWTKRRHSLSSSFQASTHAAYDDSWEEQAFAEDAAGPLGGCVWPPRSYSCSFCRREFRSAQALGGHMNVHRRDRARLKQSPGPHNEILQHDNQNPFSALEVQYPSQVCTLLYNPNPNSDPVILASSSSPPRVSALPSQGNCPEQPLFPPFSSPIIQEKPKRSFLASPQSCSNSFRDIYYQFSDLRTQGEDDSRKLESGCRAKVDYLKTDLSVSLNLVVRQSCPCPTVPDGKEEAIGCKRRRINASSVPFFLKSSSTDKHHIQSEEPELGHTPVEELDLELRLGERPKAK